MSRIQDTKQHIHENYKVYIAAGVGLVVGAAAVYLAGDNQSVTVDSWKIELFKWKSPTTNNVETVMVRRGHPGNTIRCNETGELFASQNRAAAVMGISAPRLSEHLSGKNPHVDGYTFTNLGETQ